MSRLRTVLALYGLALYGGVCTCPPFEGPGSLVFSGLTELVSIADRRDLVVISS